MDDTKDPFKLFPLQVVVYGRNLFAMFEMFLKLWNYKGPASAINCKILINSIGISRFLQIKRTQGLLVKVSQVWPHFRSRDFLM